MTRPRAVSSGHEGKIVTDGRNTFLIKNGQRRWISEPPYQQKLEMLFELEQLQALRALLEGQG